MTGKTVQVSKRVAVVWLLATLCSGLLAGAYVTGVLRPPAAPLFQVTAGKPAVNAGALAEGFRPVVKDALPAVVNISTTRLVRASEGGLTPFFQDPFFREFFGPFEAPRQRRENSLGSGVIVSKDGYLLTNDHVIRGATEIVVSLADKREFKAKVVGTDSKTDIAVLKIDGKDLPFLKLGDSAAVDVGDVVLAMGNPFGIGQTVTMGIVSAIGRGGLGIEAYEDFIQTDAAINPGNSGGALVNVRGEFIGINTAILSRAGGNQGIGFAVPSNMAREVMEQILKSGRVVRGWLGVSIQPVTPQMAKAFGLADARGALVSDVVPDSPAARAGLGNGDVIIEIDGKSVEDSRDLQLSVARMKPGTKTNLKVIRDGRATGISVTLGELPEERRAARPDTRRGGALEGVEVDELTPQVAGQLGLPRQTLGVIVVSVRPDSAAAAAGLRRGDVIQEANRKPVTSVETFERVVRQTGDQPVLLLVNRAGNTYYVVVEPQ